MLRQPEFAHVKKESTKIDSTGALIASLLIERAPALT